MTETEEMLSIQQVCERLSARLGRPVDDQWLRRRIREGSFPKPLKPTNKIAVWPESDISLYFDQLRQQRAG